MKNLNCSTVSESTKKDNNAFVKTIGNTTYNVRVCFSKSSKENFNDKLLRIIKNDIANGLVVGGDVN